MRNEQVFSSRIDFPCSQQLVISKHISCVRSPLRKTTITGQCSIDELGMGLINQLDDAACGLGADGNGREGGGGPSISQSDQQQQCYFISPCKVSVEVLICSAQDIRHQTEQIPVRMLHRCVKDI